MTPEQQCDNSNGNISDIIDIALQAQADGNELKIASARSEVYDNMNAELNKCQEQHKAKIKEIRKDCEKCIIFVAHIDAHLSEMEQKGQIEKGQKVCCKICNKDIDTIYKEEKEFDKKFLKEGK